MDGVVVVAGKEPRDAGRIVRGLDELDLRRADRQKGDPDAIVLDLHDRLERGVEGALPELQGGLDRGHDQGNVMDLAELADGSRDGGHGLRCLRRRLMWTLAAYPP